jgi:uncharacterized protein YjeT (DUF2065 family)
MWHDVLVVLALVMVIEGLLPFLSPRSWRKMVFSVAQQADRPLRIMGLISMLVGAGILYWVNG